MGLMSEYMKKVSDFEAVKVMEIAQAVKERRSIHRLHRNGYTNDRAKSMRMIASVPLALTFHPEYKKYFDPLMDAKERRKNLIAFLNKYERDTGINLRTVDKL